jgi:ribosomal-protein-alanine N-acetyltransferase
LAIPDESDESEFLGKVHASGDLHGSWVSAPSSPDAFASYLARVRSDDHAGFLLRADGQLVGVVNINGIVMGAYRSGHLGYYAFAGGERRGLMTEGLTLVVAIAFGELGLHRVEANIQPTNVASLRLVQRVGFVKEGYSERYLFVGGEWRDHERWAMSIEQFEPPGRSSR